MRLQKLGAYAFLLGVLVSIIFGLIYTINTTTWVTVVLIILGIIVGLLNIADRNVTLFLIASIAFIATSTSLNALPLLGDILRSIIVNFIHFVSPAALIVSVVAIIRIANAK